MYSLGGWKISVLPGHIPSPITSFSILHEGKNCVTLKKWKWGWELNEASVPHLLNKPPTYIP